MVRFTMADDVEVVEEETLWENRQSWREFMLSLLLGVALLAFYGVGILVLLYVLIERFKCIYLVTSYRAQCRTGILSRDRSEIDIVDIRDLSVHQTLWQRMLGTGDVELSSAGRPGAEVVFKGIKRPQEVIDLVHDRKLEILRELHQDSGFADLESDE